MGFDTIFHGEISVRRYFRDFSREIAYFSRYIGDLAINRRFFGDISRGQRGSTKVRSATVSSTRYSDATVAATVHHLYLLLRGFEPQTFWFGVQILSATNKGEAL